MAQQPFDLFNRPCGPCKDTTWTPTGLERCAGADVEQQEESNCGTKRWAVKGPQTWTPTGEFRCTGTDVEVKETNDCGTPRWTVSGPQVWAPTGETRCKDFLVENEEANDCGKTRWTPTATGCGFCPSIRLPSGGYGYHEMDPKDPAATVEISACAGDTSVDSVWIYPAPGPGHTARQNDCDGVLLGYGANTSTCATDCGCPETTVNVVNKFAPVTNVAPAKVAITNRFNPVNNFAPTTNVAAPEVNIDLPAPNLVAMSIGDDGAVTATLSSGDTVTSNPLPSC